MGVRRGGRSLAGHLRTPRPTATRRPILSHSPDDQLQTRRTRTSILPHLRGRVGGALSRSDPAASGARRLGFGAGPLPYGGLLRTVRRGGLAAGLRWRPPERPQIVVKTRPPKVQLPHLP